MKIDILVAENPYGTTCTFARGLKKALEKKGVLVRNHYVGEGHFFHALYDMLKDPPNFTFSFADVRGLNWAIPHFTYTLDPVIYVHPKSGILTCVDEKDAAFASVPFLPHAIEPIEPAQKDLDAVFFGSCFDIEAIEKRWESHPQRDFLHEAANKVLYTDASLIDVVRDISLHEEIDCYVRAKDRIELCKCFPKLSVWGDGPWKKYLKNADVYPAVPFEETLQIMRRAKRVLNSSPRLKCGLHERILYAWSCNATVVTAKNRFVDGYSQGKWEESEGVRGDFTPHTWDVRADEILQLANYSQM